MRVRVLGTVELLDDGGEPTPIGSPTQRLVLAALAATPGATVGIDTLVDAIWRQHPPRTAVDSLRTYVSRLRRLLGDALASRAGGYVLALPPGSVDAGRFEELLGRARSTDPAAVVTLLDDALALWRGAPFGEFTDVELLRGAAIRLDELALAARELRARALADAGRPVEAIAAAAELVAEAPLREGAWTVLVAALTAAGRVADAMDTYHRAREALDEAGLEPSGALRAAQTAALAGTSLPDQPRWLPIPAAGLIGRDGDVAELAELLGTARVVTLVGPGGVGKTRLALEVAHAVADRFGRGARMVELAGLADPGAVPGALVDALGLTAVAGSVEETLARAGELDLLVVVDNCEHVIDAAARAVETLVHGGRELRVLATSRERLRVDGEHVRSVDPLPFDGPAAALFRERLGAVRGTTVTDVDPAQVDRIVRRVDGLPLGIEMAAARAATLPLAELADRIEEHLGLLAHRRTSEDKHRTLGAVVAWSVALLDPDDRALFAELAVFAGTVGAEDIASVTGRVAPLDALCHLAERSLLVADLAAPRPRFGMLATIRAHAAERLAATGHGQALARRHCEYLVAVAAAADARLRGPDEAAAHARLDELVDEFRAAHAWAREHDHGLALRLSAALHLFAQSRVREEPGQWAATLVDDLGDGPLPALAAGALASAANRLVNAGDLAGAAQLVDRAVAAAGAAPERRRPLEVRGDLEAYAGRLDASAEAARQVWEAARAAGDPRDEVAGVITEALAHGYAGRFEQAERLLAGYTPATPLAPSDTGWLAFTEGEVVLDRDPDRALPALDRAIVLADSVGNRFLGGVARVSACSLRSRCGDRDEAITAFVAVIEHWRGHGDLVHQLTTLRNFAVLLQRVDTPVEAAELLGAVDAPGTAPTFGAEAGRLDQVRSWVTETLGPSRARRHGEIGRARTVPQAAEVCLEWLRSGGYGLG